MVLEVLLNGESRFVSSHFYLTVWSTNVPTKTPKLRWCNGNTTGLATAFMTHDRKAQRSQELTVT